MRVEGTIDECLRARAARRGRPYRVATTEEIAVELERWMRELYGARARVEHLERAPGGASKENFFFDSFGGQ